MNFRSGNLSRFLVRVVPALRTLICVLAVFSGVSISQASKADTNRIVISKPQFYTNLRDIYKTDGTAQILLVLHLPQGPGKAYLEAYNYTGRNISLFQFSVHSVSSRGDLVFEDLARNWSSQKEALISNIREFTIIQPKVIDDRAVEFFPKLVIHVEIGLLQQKMAKGRR